MTDAKRDNNNEPTILGTSSTDGSTPIRLKIDPSAHFINISDGSTGSNLSSPNARRDNNNVPVIMGVSSADGITPTAIYVSAAGSLLTKST